MSEAVQNLSRFGLVVFHNVLNLSAFTFEAVRKRHYWLNITPPVDLGHSLQ